MRDNLRYLGGALVAATLLVTPHPAKAVPDKVDSSTSMTPGSSGGVPGYWVTVKERVFRWIEPITPEFREAFLKNRAYDGITDWSWAWGSGANQYKGDRDWTFSELRAQFGAFGWKEGDASYGATGLDACQAPQTARNLGQAYRFLKIAQMMTAQGLTSLGDPVVFSIQADDGVSWDYASGDYVNIDPSTNLNVLPNIASEFFQGNTEYNYWTSIKRFTISDLTPQLAMQIARDLYTVAAHCGSPIALDLNGDGQISVTGSSSAKSRGLQNQFVAAGSVMFDLTATGAKRRYEWLKGTDDGFLINDREGLVTRALESTGEVDGRVLFGNAGGYDNGYYKLAKLFDHGVAIASTQLPMKPDGLLKERELDGLKVWVDTNHDAKVQPGEIKTLASLGITAVASKFRYERNRDGELLMRSEYYRQGQKAMTEDVWFAIDPATVPAAR